MVAGLLFAPRPPVDIRSHQPIRRLGRAEQMIEPEPQVALPAAGV